MSGTKVVQATHVVLHRERARRAHRTFRTAFAGLAAIVLAASGATAVGLLNLPAQRFAFFAGAIEDSSFVIDAFDTKIKGKNAVDVTVVVRNSDSTAHAADVTVQLLDASGIVLTESSRPTQSVAAGNSLTLTFSFNQPELAMRFHETFVVVDEVP